MKTLILNYKFVFICFIIWIGLNTISCSNSDDNEIDSDDDNIGDTYQTISQNRIDQTFFIEGIYVTSPNRDRPKTVPHGWILPDQTKDGIETATGIDINQTTFITIVGQRLTDESISDSSDIANLAVAPNDYDYVSITFAITDDVEANGILTTVITPNISNQTTNDNQDQSNAKIISGSFTFTRINTTTNIYGTTIENGQNGSFIESVKFIENEEAFLNNHDGTSVAMFDGTVFSPPKTYNEFLQETFNGNQNISILRIVRNTVSNNEGHRVKIGHYGLPNPVN